MKNIFDESEPTSVTVICDEPEPWQASAASRIKAEIARHTANCRNEQVTVPSHFPKAVISSGFNTLKRPKFLCPTLRVTDPAPVTFDSRAGRSREVRCSPVVKPLCPHTSKRQPMEAILAPVSSGRNERPCQPTPSFQPPVASPMKNKF